MRLTSSIIADAIFWFATTTGYILFKFYWCSQRAKEIHWKSQCLWWYEHQQKKSMYVHICGNGGFQYGYCRKKEREKKWHYCPYHHICCIHHSLISTFHYRPWREANQSSLAGYCCGLLHWTHISSIRSNPIRAAKRRHINFTSWGMGGQRGRWGGEGTTINELLT